MYERWLDSQPGLFERWGIRYFHRLSRRFGHLDPVATTDEQMVRAVRGVTITGATIAFLIGALSAGGSVLAEILTLERPLIEHYAWIGGVTLVLTAIEFAVLFVVSIHTVFRIARITGHQRLSQATSFQEGIIPNLLARAALEIPDPVQRILGIDPLAKVSKKKMMAVGLIYKLKVVMSNVLAKLILKRILAKSGVRMLAYWVSVPITGLWNAIVTFRVAREARLRLFGNLLAEHIVRHQLTDEQMAALSPAARIGCLRAVGNAVVLTQNYHPNMLMLLVRIADSLQINDGEGFDDWDAFLDCLDSVKEGERCFLLDLLAVATAFDGKLSGLEKRMLPLAFKEHTSLYMERIKKLIEFMHAGRLHAAIELCDLNFEAG
jgi:hypothetical protein